MFSGVWLQSKNVIFYYFLTFSQLPNKFYNRKFQYIQFTNKYPLAPFVHKLNSIKLREGGRKSERLREREIDRERDGDRVNEIYLQWWQ